MDSIISEILERLSTAEKSILRLKANQQMFLESKNIKPGIGTNISYDKNGLVCGCTKLTSDDIPNLSISKIDGLLNILEDKVNIGEFNRIKARITETNHESVVQIKEEKQKIEIDDIPNLPIEKIDGLKDVLNKPVIMNKDPEYEINPGIGCKIRYDSHGRIISSFKLEMNDIPEQLIHRINIIEDNLTKMTPRHVVDQIMESIVNKENKYTEPGIYTKVVVDDSGIVTSGYERLSISDLPELHIKNISGLKKALDDKANKMDLISMKDIVSRISSDINSLSDLKTIRYDIRHKVSIEEFAELKREVKELKMAISKILENI